MATGYTADVADGKLVDLKKFALRCAGAFFHDRDMDEPLPRGEPDTNYMLEAEEARKKYADLKSMTTQQVEDEVRRGRASWESHRASALESRKLKAERYNAMLAKVEAWEVPTPEHVELKKFMLEQLRMSLEHDCCPSAHWDAPWPVKTVEQWLGERLKDALDDVIKYEKRYEESVVEAKRVNAWIDALESLP